MPWYTINQAAKAIDVHPKTLRRWETSGKIIPHRTLGNQRRYSQTHLNQLQAIKSGQSPAPVLADRLLNLNQTAQKLGVSPATIQRWTKTNQLKLSVNNQLQSGYLESQLNLFLKQHRPQTVKVIKPLVPRLPFIASQTPKLVSYAVIVSLCLSLGLTAYLYFNRSTAPASPSVKQLDISPDIQVALPNVANFLNGRITIGSDTGDLSFLDQKGNLYLKNAALIQAGVHTSSLQLLPSSQPEKQIGRQYVDQATGDLMYYDGLAWISLNKVASASSSLTLQNIYDTGRTLILAEKQDIDLTLGDSSASGSATSLRLTLAGPQSQFKILGGASQNILTVDDDSTYPVTISQPTKIIANLYLPKLIDSDSDTYYLDPSSTALSLSLAGDATISATLKFSKNGEYLTNSVDGYLIASAGLTVGGTTTYGFNASGDINANKIESHDVIQIDNLKLDINTLNATNNDGLKLYDNDSKGIFIEDGGNVGIGTTAPTAKLEVTGDIKTTGGSFIDDGIGLSAPDYVFEAGYPLLSPVSLQTFISQYHHLPGIPSQAEIKASGLNLSAMILTLLEKTEENVLYILDLNRRLDHIIAPTVATEKLTTQYLSPLSQDGQITINGSVAIQGSASISGTLTASEIKSSTIDSLKEKIADIVASLDQPTASPPPSTVSAELLATPIASAAADFLDLTQLNADSGFFSEYLAVLGSAAITSLNVTNSLTINNQLLLTANSLSGLDNQLFLQPSGTGSINFLAGLMTLSDAGLVTITGNLTVTRTLTAASIASPPEQTLNISIASQSAMLIYSDINQPIATFSGQTARLSQLELASSGTATISAGTNHVVIHPHKLTDKSQIIVTFNTNYQPASKYWVSKEPDHQRFTIFVNYPVNSDTYLDWLIIN